MTIVVPSQLSEIAANLVRTYALSQFPSWRPFAYRFESKASFLSTDLFIDKPLDIYSKMSELSYDGGDAEIGEIRSECYTVSDVLSVEGLRAQSKFEIKGDAKELARALKPTKLTVFYLYQKGKTSEDNNRRLVPDDGNTVVFASRHTVIEDLGFVVEGTENDFSKVSFFGCDESLIRHSLLHLEKIFKPLEKSQNLQE